MDKNEMTPINRDFLQGVSDVLAKARKNAKTAVNLAMVYAYFEIGRMIVEEEQHGANRAAYCIVKYPDASIGELAPCGSRQMDMLACPLGSLPAGIKVIEKEQGAVAMICPLSSRQVKYLK